MRWNNQSIMKKILYILLFLYSMVQSQAANGITELKGKVTDKKTNESIVGAVVYFPDLKMGTVTGVDGTFSLGNLPQVKTIIQVKELSYRTFVQTIDLNVIKDLNVQLEESPIEGKEVIVTGTSRSTEIRREPIPIVSINAAYLKQNTATNAIDAIAKVPGVSTLSTGPNVSKPYIHGLGFNRVLTLFDGVRQEGQQWGDEHGIEVDQYLIDHIEVVKGPASLIYGSDALGGVVNLLPANPQHEGDIRGEFLSNYQSNNGLWGTSFFMAGNNRGLIWDTRISHKQAKDFQNRYDGRVYNTGFNETDFNASLGINKSWGYSHVNLSLYDNLQEIPDGERDSVTRQFTRPITETGSAEIVNNKELNAYRIGDIHQRVQHMRLLSSSSFILGSNRLNVNLSFQRSIRREFSHPTDPQLAGLYLELNTWAYDIKYYLPILKGFETTGGVNGMFQTNNTDQGTDFLIPNYQLFDVGPFVHVKRNIGKLDLAAGLRYDSRFFNNSSMYLGANPNTGFDMVVAGSDTNNTGVSHPFKAYNHVFSGASGSYGLTYNFSDNLSIKGNIARGFRAPNIAEISSLGVHPGTGYEQIGDGSLKPEFSLQEDIGLFFDTRHFSFNAEVFNNVISNYIYNEKLQSFSGGDSLFMQNGNAYPVFKYTQTEANLYGGELSIDLHPHPFDWLHFENSLSVLHAINRGGHGAHITDSTKYLPFIPPFHTNSELRAELRKSFGPFTHTFVKLGLQYYAAQNEAFLGNGTETKTPGYILLDAGLGADINNKKGKTLFVISILGTNLADLAYQSNMSRLKYMDPYPNNATGRSGIYNMGRNISFKVTIPINIRKNS